VSKNGVRRRSVAAAHASNSAWRSRSGEGGLAGHALFPAHDVEGGEIAPLDQRVKLGADLRVASLGRRRKIASGEQDTRPFGGWHLYLTVLGRT
jgi:hypothetical protein